MYFHMMLCPTFRLIETKLQIIMLTSWLAIEQEVVLPQLDTQAILCYNCHTLLYLLQQVDELQSMPADDSMTY